MTGGTKFVWLTPLFISPSFHHFFALLPLTGAKGLFILCLPPHEAIRAAEKEKHTKAFLKV
jgi:hypothetical protein